MTRHHQVNRTSAADDAPARKARRYLRAQAGFRTVLAGVSSAWTGMWLGVLGREALHAIDAALYDTSEQYSSDEHKRRGFFPWEARAIDEYFPPSGHILLLAAGAGRDLLALADRGYSVDGYECNPVLLAHAADLVAGHPSARILPLPRDGAPTEGGPWDGAIVGWGGYMLVSGRERRIALLRGIRARVRDGAPLLLSFFTRPGDTSRLRIVHRVASALRKVRGAEPAEMGDDLAPNFVHRFVEEEIRAEMEAAGFGLARYEPQRTGRFESGWAIGHAR
jgi:hypothetical protein